MSQTKINWLGFFVFFALLIIFAGFGVRLPLTINQLNGIPLTSFYGHFASYIIIAGVFYAFAQNIPLTKKVKVKKGGKKDGSKR